ncbi:MAG: hypothetical protein IJG33_03690 [Selenomonadaceae bacterium]|nr:hypothetical protein [Selenomonadaceae bacterium]
MVMKQKNLPAIVPELFEHEQFGQFRYIKRDEEIWFVGKDVAVALGYKESEKAVREHVPDKFKGVSVLDTPGGNQKVVIISEAGLYRLAFSSKLPSAVKFTDWVCEEVLPSIRKYGFYGLLNGEQALQLPDKQYLKYLGGLDYFQYKAHLEQLTREKRWEHYRRLEERIDSNNMTQEEILSLGNDPYIIVNRIGNGSWKASY